MACLVITGEKLGIDQLTDKRDVFSTEKLISFRGEIKHGGRVVDTTGCLHTININIDILKCCGNLLKSAQSHGILVLGKSGKSLQKICVAEHGIGKSLRRIFGKQRIGGKRGIKFPCLESSVEVLSLEHENTCIAELGMLLGYSLENILALLGFDFTFVIRNRVEAESLYICFEAINHCLTGGILHIGALAISHGFHEEHLVILTETGLSGEEPGSDGSGCGGIGESRLDSFESGGIVGLGFFEHVLNVLHNLLLGKCRTCSQKSDG